MSRAKWIWKYGEYEIYHHKLAMCRRQDKGCDCPEVIWRIAPNEVSVRFYKKLYARTDTVLTVVTHSRGMAFFNDERYPVNQELHIPAGTYDVYVMLYDLEGLPSCFIDSEYLKTDESWVDESYDHTHLPVACEPAFYSPKDNPAVFPFRYKKVEPVQVTEVEGGRLYDFGKELFGPVTLTGYPPREKLYLTYGESREEALDYPEAHIREELLPGFDPVRPGRAFRYLFARSESGSPVELAASYEYLPVEDIASFRCEEEMVNRLWEVCSYTFHLNSREVYLDGIKRDRWCWAGDAYQSFLANYYLYFEPQIIRRTILGLLGKPPYETHINTINDYSFYLIISIWDYYYATGDKEFIGRIYKNLKLLYDFITARTDERGYVVKQDGDWIFLDWSDMDKEGILCGEQILLWKAYEAMEQLAALMGEESASYRLAAEQLKEAVMRDFWDEERGLFFDRKADGGCQITRHPNILAILYDFVDQERAGRIAESVIYSKSYTKITTPYFKLYELSALCKLGDMERVQQYIRSYWGGMIAEGAATIWERYDPAETHEEKLAMYGLKYGTSLCHAWGCGPIYLLGRYCCGVAPTDVAYRTFQVKPDFGSYRRVHAVVPVNGGQVELCYKDGKLAVTATVPGGTLIYGEKVLVLPANQRVVVE